MSSVNKAIIIGRLGKDPEVRYTQGGQAVCSMSVATDSTWKNKGGEKQSKTEWHRVKAWGKLAEVAGEYLAKGRQVYVEGRLETSKYEKDGVDHYSTEIVASEIKFLGDKGEGKGGAKGEKQAEGSGAAAEEDIPF